MKYLSPQAARLYLKISTWSFVVGQIGWTQFLGRLEALCALSASSDPARTHAERVLLLSSEEKSTDDDWPCGQDELTTDADQSERLSSFESDDGDGSSEADLYCYLIAGSKTGLSNWRFHLYDDDPFPSIPHGHEKTDRRRKLDPYLGWTYYKTQQGRREPRWKIVALWNDGKFREAARRAISYHLEHHPHVSWRVANPLKLPRKQRSSMP